MSVNVLVLVLVFVLSVTVTNALKLNNNNSRKQIVASNKLVPEVIDANYNLAAGSAVLGTAFGVLENLKGPTAKLFGGGAVALTLFGGFLAFQTTTLRFQFDDTNFSLVKVDKSSVGENIVVGGENSWRYDSFVNWDFLPNEDFPVLVYFKETQTPKEKWVTAPIVVDNLDGQAHFFPAIANVQQLKSKFIQYGCKKADAATKAAAQGSKLPTKITF